MLKILGKNKKERKILKFLLIFSFKMTTQALSKWAEISLDKDVDNLEALVERETQMSPYLDYFTFLNTPTLYSKNMVFFRKV